MAIEYKFIGWNKDEKENHDKVWGVIKLTGGSWDGDYVSFWGRRGKKLQTKIHKDEVDWHMQRLADKKAESGYKEINREQLNSVYPEFQQDLEKTTFWALLKV